MPNGTPRLSFDRLADIFDDQRSLPPAAVAALHAAFGELADAGFTALIEPGAGTGRIAIPALAAGLRVTALDISRPMLGDLRARLDAAPEVTDRCEVVVGDATALPFEDDTFDAGVLAQVLYLIPDWRRALHELARVVCPSGSVLLVQERTTMSPALMAWDRAWREAVAAAGHIAIPGDPDDSQAVAALAERVGAVEERTLASWDFGQPVADALVRLDGLRPLYDALTDGAWAAALAAFRTWHASSGLSPDTRLAGKVTLTLVSGTVPENP